MKYSFLLSRFFRFFLIFVLITAWVFSGWPRIWENPAIPPEVKLVKASPDIEVKKPTSYTDADASWVNPTQCYDTTTAGDETTEGDIYNAADADPDITFHTWQAKGQTYTATVLKLKWKTSGGFTDDQFAIQYSKDGGSIWNDLVPLGVHNETTIQTSSANLDANQDLSQVQVKVVQDRVGGGDKDYIYIYDIWTEGTYTAFSTAIEIRAQNYTTSVSSITFPEGAPEATVSQPYNNINGSGSPQTFGGAGSAKPVVTLYNGGGSTLTIWYNITTFTNSIVSNEYYLVNNKGAACADAGCITNNATFDADTTTGTTIAAGAGNEKDLYLKVILSAVAGKTGTSTLTILGETL